METQKKKKKRCQSLGNSYSQSYIFYIERIILNLKAAGDVKPLLQYLIKKNLQIYTPTYLFCKRIIQRTHRNCSNINAFCNIFYA